MNARQWRRSARIAWLLFVCARIVILIDNGPGFLTVSMLVMGVGIAIMAWMTPIKHVTITSPDGTKREFS